MWKKVGITFKEYKRGANAGLLHSATAFSPTERERMQGWMDDVYEVFKGHVTATRGNRLKKPIDDLAGGRVYTGKQALELGLIDKIGTLQDAIKHVADQAKLSDYEVRVVPEPKNFIEQILEELSGVEKDDSKELSLPTPSRRASRGASAPGVSLVEIALPHLKHLDPRRVALITSALQQLQLVQQEGVILMMPQNLIP
jgi:protease-4